MSGHASSLTPEHQQDLLCKLDAMRDAVTAACEAFRRQLGLSFAPVGLPGAPDCAAVCYGSAVALTGQDTNFIYAVVCPETTAAWLTCRFLDLEAGAAPALAHLADALNEIPNVAAGTWKARRRGHGEHYQLGLPLFMRGSSWLRFFSKGVNALAQRLIDPEGHSLQIVMVWQSGVKPGGILSMATQNSAVADATAHLPMNVLQEATKAVIETCDVQMGLNLEIEANPGDPREANVAYGSSIALTTEVGGGWNLAVMCDKASSNKLTRILFAMDSGEDPAMEDLADGIGEIANVAAGVFKASRLAAGERVQIGLPLFMEGRGCIDFFASGLRGLSQSLNGPDGIVVHVILIWQEG
ncbi:MAG TPA: chemotaxis protein CheX [Candidatus Krumholzibacteria bacterium]|nr:chemotaxis protein CheX [Candidatus Krumholzibacteria bacterium]HPD70438.1 chemotaxis protein CheX [Candidatus Krumholzibacteria bacterium]HRY39862.1 chemotaxis protein CheX [Candidatus Krumholzibacteria bacterium]